MSYPQIPLNAIAVLLEESIVVIDKTLRDILYFISDVNQEKIVAEGGLDALLMLLRSSHNTTILRVASGAVANLAMNGI